MGKLESVATAATWALMNVLAVLILFDPLPSETALQAAVDSTVHTNRQS